MEDRLIRYEADVRYLGSYPKAVAPDELPGVPDDGARHTEPVNGSGAARFTAAADWLARVRAGTSA